MHGDASWLVHIQGALATAGALAATAGGVASGAVAAPWVALMRTYSFWPCVRPRIWFCQLASSPVVQPDAV
jgi:hypothetical protein